MRLRFEFIVAAALLALSVFVFAAGAPEDYAQKRSTLDRELASECFALGQWCLEQGLVNEARAQFERALILQPTTPRRSRSSSSSAHVAPRASPVSSDSSAASA